METLEYENHEGKREENNDSEKIKRPIDQDAKMRPQTSSPSSFSVAKAITCEDLTMSSITTSSSG